MKKTGSKQLPKSILGFEKPRNLGDLDGTCPYLKSDTGQLLKIAGLLKKSTFLVYVNISGLKIENFRKNILLLFCYITMWLILSINLYRIWTELSFYYHICQHKFCVIHSIKMLYITLFYEIFLLLHFSLFVFFQMFFSFQ